MQFFDYPPIRFSPANRANSVDKAKQEVKKNSNTVVRWQTESEKAESGPVSPKANEQGQLPSLWGTLARITPQQVKQIRELKSQLNKSQIKEENIMAAFTFGRKLKYEDLERWDYKNQFNYMIDIMNQKMKRKNSL